MLMPISEERLQLLLPARLKRAVAQAARRRALSVGAYVRKLIEEDLRRNDPSRIAREFPFGEAPIRTGRVRGSVDHDRPS